MAQVKTGGRGKAGGVKVAKSPEEAEQKASEILGHGHQGATPCIASWSPPVRTSPREYYFSLLLDRANRNYLAMCSVEGGMEIEQLAVERPRGPSPVWAVDPNVGIDAAKAKEIVEAAKFDAETGAKVAPVLEKLWDVYREEDATLVEVNPLVKTGAGDIVALDGKITLDDNAVFRQEGPRRPGRRRLRGPAGDQGQGPGPQLRQARRQRVGIIGNGAGPGHVHPRRGRLRR